jgi:hypothetical protein
MEKGPRTEADSRRRPLPAPAGGDPNMAKPSLSGSEASGENDRFSFSFLLFWFGFWPQLARGPL